ncbi:hypothetical protein M2302_000260 [Micromonospora sp. A200]|nr:siphovirus ReqiPepy6 Gp37-like family protein [Micromonospora sp. A200]MDH6460109.1 hypothetical protein [Micromonospora sp. A200]
MQSRPAGIAILITDRNLNVLGDPIANWTSLEVTLRFNEPSSGQFTAPASPELIALISGDEVDAARRVVVVRDGQVFVAGPIEQAGPQRWAVDGADSEPGTVTVQFADDLALVATRLTYPTPSAVAWAQTTTARWTATGNAEDIMRSLVDLNVGPGALAVRRLPKLILGVDQGVGSSVTFGTRFEPLCDALRSVAIAGGGLGFRTQQVGTDVEFQVFQPVDRTGSVRFSPGLGNLRSYSYEPAAPTATAVIVGGKDVGTSRVIVERVDTAGVNRWWRMETFRDQRQSDDTTTSTSELQQAAYEALVKGAAMSRLVTVTVDTPDQRYGVHYGLGDRVSVELASGAEVADVVREANLRISPDGGEQVTVLVGSQDATSDPVWSRHIAVERRMHRLETI